MCHVESLHVRDTAQTGDLAVHGETGGLKHGLPGILVRTGHVVVGVVTRHDHQRTQHHGGVTGFLDSRDHGLARGILGLALHGADEYVLIAQLVHLGGHLAVSDLRHVRRTVTHQHVSHTGLLGGGGGLVTALAQSSGDDGLGNGFLVGVDDGGVVAHLTQHRLGDLNGLELVTNLVDGVAHLVVLSTVHQMSGLHHQLLHAVGDSALQSLLHVVDLLAVTGLDVVDDDLSGEGAAHGPIGVGLLQGVLNALDVGYAAVVEGGAEGHHQQLLLADLVLVAGIVLGRVTGVQTEIVGAGFLALHQCLLGVGQGVPSGLGSLTLGVGLLGARLHVDGVDQRGDLVGGGLISIGGGRIAVVLGVDGGLIGLGGGHIVILGVVGNVLVAAGGQHAHQHHCRHEKCKCFLHGELPRFKKCSERI